MASPDLDALHNFRTNGYATNNVPRNPEYTIPDVVLHSPTIRKIRVLSIGAGLTGIMTAYRIQKELENVEHIIYEKNADIGGTWLENRYPGCACDIPSHAYTLPFALNPDWPRFFSYAPEIWAYLTRVCEVFGLRKYMRFESRVVGCHWQQDRGQWRVQIEQHLADGSTRLFEDYCHVLLNGGGLLNRWKWPDVPGMDKFKGRIVHTANWPEDYKEEQWKNDRVAVIGSGASSIQTVATMQPHVKQMDVFVRTGIWFVELADNYGHNHAYTPEQKAEFHASPTALVQHAKSIEDKVNGIWGAFYTNSEAQAKAQSIFGARMAEFIKDERLLKGFTPEFGLGCRRVTPGDPYMLAVQQDNVDVHFTAVTSLSTNGVVGADGLERAVDTVVCATGFDTTYRPRFPIVGRNGVSLADKWRVCPEAYMGMMIPDMPNYIMYIAPNFPVENGAVTGPIWAVTGYALQLIRKLQTEFVLSVSPRQSVTDNFNAHCQEWVRHTVWTDECRSWYKDNETGRVNAVWPGSSLHYIEAIDQIKWEDMEIDYVADGNSSSKNRFAYLGMGWTRSLVLNGDASPYLSQRMMDPVWMRAVGIDRKEAIREEIRRLRGELELLEREEEEGEEDKRREGRGEGMVDLIVGGKTNVKASL